MRALLIDNFAGGGGASTGIERAAGRPIDVAINHDPEAVAMHAANHPATRHLCQSIMAVDPLDATAGAPVALIWFSPDCKHHSKAKGGKPREKNIRDLAWVVPHWIKRLQQAAKKAGRSDWRRIIRVIVLENVEEFLDWGPLTMLQQPDPARKGETYNLWAASIRKLGGRIEVRKVRACDHGAPTSRLRVYIVIRFDGLPIVWPAPTHGKPGTPEVEAGIRLPWRTAAECIDWSIPAPSIFTRARPLKEATLRRIAHGVMRYVVSAAQPFVVPLTHHGGARGHAADEPAPTVTAAHRGELATVDAAIVPITHTANGPTAHNPGEPLRTITTARGGELAAVSATITPFYGEKDGRVRAGSPAVAPLPTVTCDPRFGLVTAHLEKFSENSRGRPADAPLDAVMAGAPRHAAVTAFLSSFYTSNTNGGRGKPDLPLKTVLAGGQHHGVVCAHMEQANTGMVGHPAGRPLSTIVSRGTQQRLVETTTVAADALPPELLDRAVQVAAFLIKYYGTEASGHGLDAPIGTVTTLDRFAVVTVTIEAVTYVIVDIGMRMLSPRELARAQGFPDSYILDPVGPNGKPLTKSAQIRMIGNSVCPDVAAALVRANLPELCAAPVDEVAA